LRSVTTLEAVLAELEKRDIKLWVEGERLRYTAPQGALTPLLRTQLQTHKVALMALLRKGQTADDATPAVRTFPPSFTQRRFWTLQQLNPTDPFYNVPFGFRLCGPLDAAILRQSFNAIVRRHEVLRTTLHELNGELMQVVAATGEMPLSITDLQDCPPAAPADTVNRVLQTEMQRPFDLAREPGLRVRLLQVDSQEYFLLLCFHNTLYDQNSLMVLLQELSLHYTALSTGASTLLPPPTQYVEYVRWQESLLAAGMEERLHYWREWLTHGEPPALTWTPHRPPPATPTFHTHVPWQRYAPELTQQLKALSQRHGVTLYMTLLTAYAMILQRYTGCADLTIGTTYSNRPHWQFASLIGATIDVPALRIDMTDNPDLATLLARVRAVVTAALTYQDVPWERIAPSLQLASTPLFRVVFTFFAETPHGQLQLPGITVTFLEELINELSRPALYLVLWENQTVAGDALTGYWMHKQDVFSAETAEQMNEEFRVLLTALVNHPTQTVRELLATY